MKNKIFICAITGEECPKENIRNEHGENIKPCSKNCEIVKEWLTR